MLKTAIAISESGGTIRGMERAPTFMRTAISTKDNGSKIESTALDIWFFRPPTKATMESGKTVLGMGKANSSSLQETCTSADGNMAREMGRVHIPGRTETDSSDSGRGIK